MYKPNERSFGQEPATMRKHDNGIDCSNLGQYPPSSSDLSRTCKWNRRDSSSDHSPDVLSNKPLKWPRVIGQDFIYNVRSWGLHFWRDAMKSSGSVIPSLDGNTIRRWRRCWVIAVALSIHARNVSGATSEPPTLNEIAERLSPWMDRRIPRT